MTSPAWSGTCIYPAFVHIYDIQPFPYILGHVAVLFWPRYYHVQIFCLIVSPQWTACHKHLYSWFGEVSCRGFQPVMACIASRLLCEIRDSWLVSTPSVSRCLSYRDLAGWSATGNPTAQWLGRVIKKQRQMTAGWKPGDSGILFPEQGQQPSETQGACCEIRVLCASGISLGAPSQTACAISHEMPELACIITYLKKKNVQWNRSWETNCRETTYLERPHISGRRFYSSKQVNLSQKTICIERPHFYVGRGQVFQERLYCTLRSTYQAPAANGKRCTCTMLWLHKVTIEPYTGQVFQ